ncbi:hypothetical protein M4951_01390 [Blastopirellula sp. J2-11]|uniref:hypothetical protein n=1 Tax=Blastopirellula sp. J2-11 TaxID=2943192 RepID=UPI0021C7D82C|nr:hypothetical protein [Blastopirellula sp. J2-11]UUO06979.1 hypothetical protein M4951_01390 [Blastopirellula sp. J2-11]
MGKIVGDSPLALPMVCLHCAANIKENLGERMIDSFGRPTLRKNEQEGPLSVSYSICPECGEKAQVWQRRRGIALCVLVCLLIAGPVSLGLLFAVFYSPTGLDRAALIFAFVFIFIFIVDVGGIYGVAYCEAKAPNRLALSRAVGDTMVLSGAGRKFVERFQE